MREQLEPALMAQAELRFLYSARSRDDHGEMRQIVSIWEASSADEHELEARLHHAFDCEKAKLVTGRHVSVMTVNFFRTTDLSDASILRVFHGRTHAHALSTYLDEMRAASLVQGDEERRARAVFMSSRPPDKVTAVSIWSDWDTLSEATGGNLQTPIATRHGERLRSWEATHYEIVPLTVAGAVSNRPKTAV